MALPRCRIWGRPKPSAARPQTRCRTLVARGCPAACPCAPAVSPGASFSVTAAWLDWNAEDSVHVSIISLTEIMQWMWVHTLSFPPPGASLPLFCPFRLRRWRASGISSAHPSVSLISGAQMMMLWKISSIRTKSAAANGSPGLLRQTRWSWKISSSPFPTRLPYWPNN